MSSDFRVAALTGVLVVAATFATAGCAGGRSGDGRLPGVSQERAPTEDQVARSAPPDAGVEEQEADADDDLEELGAFEDAIDAVSRRRPSAEGPERGLGLRFGVVERGPGKRWLLALLNDGKESVRVIADLRLLWFEVEVPAKRKKLTTCRLPGALFPERIDRRAELVLEPGQALADSFDPRLYCFGVKGQTDLVPGAVIKPYFGWPEKKKAVFRQGKREQVLAEQSPPFVATPATVISGRNARIPSQDELCDDGAQASCAKLLAGEAFSLRSEYKAWSSARLEEDDKLRENPGPIDIVLTQGSDAQAERNATVTLSVKNRSKRELILYLRRELVSFEVVGPDGTMTCDAEPDHRVPDRQAFQRLRKGGSLTLTSRLIELCPSGTLARPGLYLVHARYDANQRGDEYNLDAFVGRVVSLSPAAVRVKTGDLPFQRARPIRPIAHTDE